MKKLFTMLTVVALTTTISFAQTFGAKVGTSLASWYGADVEDAEMKVGIHVGGFATFGDDAMRLTTEVVYNQRGVKASDSFDDGWGDIVKTEQTINLNYLDVNAIGNYFVSDNLSLNAGIGVGLYMGGTYESKVTYLGSSTTDSGSFDSDDGFRGMDLASNFGLTFYINDVMHIDARYGMGLLSLDEDGDIDIYNSTIQLSFGYAFGN